MIWVSLFKIRRPALSLLSSGVLVVAGLFGVIGLGVLP
jgi:hypothetical protein